MNKKAKLFVKFGEPKHMEAFHKEGHMFMKSPSIFRDGDFDGFLRSDKSEALEFSRHVDGESITIDGNKYILRGQFRLHSPSADLQKIYSLYCITEENLNSHDERLSDFGNSAVVILDVKKYLERVSAAADSSRFKYERDFVEYVQKEEHAGQMGPFRKYSELSYQSEYRILFHNIGGKDLSDFYIGDITDISVLCSCRDALDMKYQKS